MVFAPEPWWTCRFFAVDQDTQAVLACVVHEDMDMVSMAMAATW